MSDKRQNNNNFEDGDIIDVTGEVIDSNFTGSIDEIISEVYRDSVTDDPIPDVVNSLEDALKVVDNSDLPPSPAVRRSIPVATERSDSGKVDKYGLPVTRKDSKPASKALVPQRQTQIAAIDTSDKIYVPKKTASLTSPAKTEAKLYGAKQKALPSQPEIEMPDFNEPDVDKGPPDFKIKFDFESAYKDPPENKPLRRRRERRTGLVGGILFAVFILCIGLVLGSAIWLATMDVLGFGTEDEQVNVTVPAGFLIEDVTDMLFDAGLIRYKGLFALFADYSNAEDKIAPGSYILNKNYDYRALVQGMTPRTGIRVETTVVIPEGFTMAQIFTLLENEGVCSADDLWDTATHHDFNFFFLDKETLGDKHRLEGFLFPDTYNFYKDSTAVQAITRMLRGFENKFSEQYIDRADFLGYTVHDIITIASMIEREAGSDDERSRIAAVIYNRLHNPGSFPRLEIDATIHYAIAGTGIPFSTSFESEYNTYLHPGLPPGPISNPGMASIRAALYPMTTNEYYYALNRNGTHNFFRNAADHINFVNSDQYGG